VIALRSFGSNSSGGRDLVDLRDSQTARHGPLLQLMSLHPVQHAIEEADGVEYLIHLERTATPHSRGVRSRRHPGKDSFTVVETVRRYLPDTLGA
jgi:hypothetical protein